MHAPLFAKSVHVHEIFSLLFGGDTVIREDTGHDGTMVQAVVAYYVDSNQIPRHVLICDHAFANSAGAALSLILPAVVAQAVKAKTIDGTLVDNLHEVLNISANLFSSEDDMQVRLDRVDLLPKERFECRSAIRHHFELLIPRYPAGRIQLLKLV
ncbi:hypothetical protein SH661x_003273 [Planctomicrobium sp. SH661]|uniref:hypothetical protein n=1 Tax=Planctomicrobium sp. SH661 TaxID=3448124 RepID=UPI003F5BF589